MGDNGAHCMGLVLVALSSDHEGKVRHWFQLQPLELVKTQVICSRRLRLTTVVPRADPSLTVKFGSGTTNFLVLSHKILRAKHTFCLFPVFLIFLGVFRNDHTAGQEDKMSRISVMGKEGPLWHKGRPGFQKPGRRSCPSGSEI